MNEVIVWEIVLSAIVAFIGWVLKDKADETKRLGILLNQTREEIAKEYVTKREVHAEIDRVIQSIALLDSKIDRLMETAHDK